MNSDVLGLATNTPTLELSLYDTYHFLEESEKELESFDDYTPLARYTRTKLFYDASSSNVLKIKRRAHVALQLAGDKMVREKLCAFRARYANSEAFAYVNFNSPPLRREKKRETRIFSLSLRARKLLHSPLVIKRTPLVLLAIFARRANTRGI